MMKNVMSEVGGDGSRSLYLGRVWLTLIPFPQDVMGISMGGTSDELLELVTALLQHPLCRDDLWRLHHPLSLSYCLFHSRCHLVPFLRRRRFPIGTSRWGIRIRILRRSESAMITAKIVSRRPCYPAQERKPRHYPEIPYYRLSQ